MAGIILLGIGVTVGAEEPGSLGSGLEHFARGEYSAAQAAFRNAVANDPTSARAHYFLGLSNSELGQTSEAAESFEAALRLDPERVDAYFHLGVSRYKLDEFEAAVQALDESIARLPNNANAFFFRGLAEQGLDRHASSIPYFEGAMARDPDYSHLAYFNIGLAHDRTGDSGAAIAAFEQAVALDPSSSTAKFAQDFIDRIVASEPDKEDESAWDVRVAAGVAYDDRVTVSQIDEDSGVGDFVTQFDFSVGYQILDDPELSLDTGYSFGHSVYDEQTNFNLQIHSASLGASRDVGGMTLGLTYTYTRALLGGFDFLGDNIARASIFLPINSAWYASGAYEFEVKDFVQGSSNDFDAVQHGAGLDNFIFFNESRSYVLAGLLAESESANGPQFDCLAGTGKLELVTPLAFLVADLKVRAGYKFQHKNYDNVTESLGSERIDNRHTALLQLTYAIADDLELEVNYDYYNSISNQESSDYTKSTYGFSLEYSY